MSGPDVDATTPDAFPDASADGVTVPSDSGSDFGSEVTRVPPDLIRWIKIEGGRYEMGSDIHRFASPAHEVTVQDFRLMETEVTVAMYRRCVDVGGCTAPGGTSPDSNWSLGRDDHPVDYVTWHQARVFCRWATARLPTEAEWEYVARSGGLDVDFPWGDDEPDCSRAVMNDGCGTRSTAPICSRPRGNSIHDICDLAGNVWEWVEDVYVDTYEDAPRDGTARTTGSEDRVMRGGSYLDWNAVSLSAANRIAQRPNNGAQGDGFRCADRID